MLSEKEIDQAREIQDRVLAMWAVTQFVANCGDGVPLFEGGPSASQIRRMIYPEWRYKFEELLRNE